jgi:predicted metal-binding membrane protein
MGAVEWDRQSKRWLASQEGASKQPQSCKASHVAFAVQMNFSGARSWTQLSSQCLEVPRSMSLIPQLHARRSPLQSAQVQSSV